MNDLRQAAQQALEALEEVDGPITALLGSLLGSPAEDAPGTKVRASITALRAALVQQAKPDHETRAELAEQQVVQLAEERDHYRNLWQKAQQAEPLNLSDPAIQKRLAAQWGYVPATQAEPVAWRCACGANLYLDEYGHPASRAAPRYGKPQQAEPVEDVLLSAAGLALDALEHDRQAAARSGRSISMLSSRAIEELRGAFRAALAQEQAEPAQAISECIAVLRPMVKGKFPHEQALDELVGYTAPPQRKPLTDEEIVDAVREADLDWHSGWTLDEHEPNRFTTLVRAVEQAHGIKERR